jgi:S1-C subfamily serine protease
MPHNSDSSARFLTRGLGAVMVLLAAAPLAAQAQTHGTLRAEAVVISFEGTRAWEAVARRLDPAGSSVTEAPAGSPAMLATIEDRTIVNDSTAAVPRRVLTIDYLRN